MGRRLNERKPDTRIGGFLKGLMIGSVVAVTAAVVLSALLPAPERPAEVAAVEPEAVGSGGDEIAAVEAEAPSETEAETAVAAGSEPEAAIDDDALMAEIDAAFEAADDERDSTEQAGTGSESAEDPAVAEAAALEAERLSLLPPGLPETDRPLAEDALTANAVAVAESEAPQIALVLDTDAEGALPAEVLTALPLQATLAIRPGAEGADALGGAARTRNWEVIALLPVQRDQEDVPAGALSATMTPAEIEARTETALAHLGPAVAATAEFGEGFGSDVTLRAAFYETLAKHGYGWVAPGEADEGGGIPQIAASAVAGDAAGVTEALDQAARDAAANGRAAVTIPATREALAAAMDWMIRGGALGADLAPVSAVIRRAAG